MIQITERDLKTILMFAVRYAIPRGTFAFKIVFNVISENFKEFDDAFLSSMVSDIDNRLTTASNCIVINELTRARKILQIERSKRSGKIENKP